MNKVAKRMGFQVETGAETGESLSMGEGMQAVSNELSFGDMAKISGAAGVGAALGEGVIHGVRHLLGDSGYDPEKHQVEFKVVNDKGDTVAGMKFGESQLRDEAKKAKEQRAKADEEKAEDKSEAKAEDKPKDKKAKKGN